MTTLWLILALLTAISFCAYHRFGLGPSSVMVAVVLAVFSWAGIAGYGWWIAFAVTAVLLNVSVLRRALLSNPLFGVYKKVMPSISRTEKEALEAGTTWWEAKLFSGMPNWRTLHNLPAPRLSAEEQAFMDGPVKTVCGMVSDWEVAHERADLPPEVWQYLKDEGFFSLIIPRRYGGREFSAYAHSQILIALNSVSPTLGSTVSVPNSLGPAELLLHYGTDDQKNYYLPRLAKGLEIPCFALTSPEAGSDAGSIPDVGIICKGIWEGKEIVGMRLTWDKRYITLAPVATVLGLAFKLQDPEHLLGETEDLGITCALIPTTTKGVIIGRRHWPLGVPFQNGPTQGSEVFVPLDYIIGGAKMAGQGWRMLVECLSAGRAISLPSSGTAGTKVAAHTAGAYGRIRQQFRTPIGQMEGIEEMLGRIGGLAYATDAVRTFTTAAVDAGEKPSVASAIVKYHATENGRQAIIDAMDVHGGKGICLGPNNYLGMGYVSQPIGITVEGANILTRNLIIYGQGAIRCHPYVLPEMMAAQNPDQQKGKKDFDHALWGHIGFAMSNKVRSLWLGLTGARLAAKPVSDFTGRYYQQLGRLSAVLAFWSDISMAVLGGSLKRRERLSARLGDILSHLYIASATLKFFHDKGRPAEEKALVQYAVENALFKAQEAIYGLSDNFPNRLFGRALRFISFPYGRSFKAPGDRLSHQIAKLLVQPGIARQALIEPMYLEPSANNRFAELQQCLEDTVAAEPIWKRLRKELGGEYKSALPKVVLEKAKAEKRVSSSELELLERQETLRRKIIAVDDFDPADLVRAQFIQQEKGKAENKVA
ncbi:acyl-CoA dehydrogenase [Permianibacter aggregans]|uniref:Acyl-coenzyme A dehydrogenase n=1 Tax=Permianibacter aggregans TaxID=1510150 RepID=A0A4R6UY48_9GAMM|nr:acyl-CoA dehydrogenase [Permianibacter aggregans]QGX41435.1 acyl-CoA dehydrogenase [Permianibacter aggregans]TDQ51226.1 acyl-CoA dehydrogenase [Permianibacter aggregans]